jgi:carbamoyltransferase
MSHKIVLGISSYYHDSSAAILKGNEIVAAVQQERVSRIKNDRDFPFAAIKECLALADLQLQDIDLIVYYEKPYLKFDRIVNSILRNTPYGRVAFQGLISNWSLNARGKLSETISGELMKIDSSFRPNDRIIFSSHHLSHAASAYFPSPFDKALVITLDGVGEWETGAISVGDGPSLVQMESILYPNSLGFLYSAFTYHCGFKVNDGEYKLMGLAPYGEPVYVGLIKDKLICLNEDGSFSLQMKYFDFDTNLRMTNNLFSQLFNIPRRETNNGFPSKEYCDLAASIQCVTEEIVLKIVKYGMNKYEISNICLAGGVALNCVANGMLVRTIPDLNLWVQPAAGDAGGALGAAYVGAYLHANDNNAFSKNVKPTHDSMKWSLLGREFSDDEIQLFLDENSVNFKVFERESLNIFIAGKLATGKIVGWFQGKAEWGPRSLGNRSILADPRNTKMQSHLNLSIKFRESFRPFAPAVLKERSLEYFYLDDSPYMLLVSQVRENRLRVNLHDSEIGPSSYVDRTGLGSEIPAVTHVDGSARVQTVSAESNGLFYELLKEFENQTGCPLLINTSFNVNNEPIVYSPRDAYSCYLATDMDILVLGSYVIEKS